MASSQEDSDGAYRSSDSPGVGQSDGSTDFLPAVPPQSINSSDKRIPSTYETQRTRLNLILAALKDPNSSTYRQLCATIRGRIDKRISRLVEQMTVTQPELIAKSCWSAAQEVNFYYNTFGVFNMADSMSTDQLINATRQLLQDSNALAEMIYILSAYGNIAGAWSQAQPVSAGNIVPTTTTPRTVEYMKMDNTMMAMGTQDGKNIKSTASRVGKLYSSSSVHPRLLDLPDDATRKVAIGLFLKACSANGKFKIDDNKIKANIETRISELLQIIADVTAEGETGCDGQSLQTESRGQLLEFVCGVIETSMKAVAFDTADHLGVILMGSPGTGKTVFARTIGRLYYSIGRLLKNTFVEATPSSFIGEYLGQTSIKTHELLMTALEGTLFIDEAHALGKSGDYAAEAASAIVGFLTQHIGQICFVAAGYPKQMKCGFLSLDPGMLRRFPTVLTLPEFSVTEMVNIFCAKLRKLSNSTIRSSKNANLLLQMFTRQRLFTGGAGDMEVLATRARDIAVQQNANEISRQLMCACLRPFCDVRSPQIRACSDLASCNVALFSADFISQEYASDQEIYGEMQPAFDAESEGEGCRMRRKRARTQ